MKLLNLNCQKAMNPNFKTFFKRTLAGGKHKILLLQEASGTVIKIIQKHSSKKYKIIRHKTPNGDRSEVCIVHSNKLKCIDSDFSYIEDSDGKFFGILMATFKSRKTYLSAASVHLPSYLKPQKRLNAVRHIKKKFALFIKKHPETEQVILAGDFNSILPWEHEQHKNILSSFLVPVRNKLGYTYHTDRVEPIDTSSKIVRWFGLIGFSFKINLDHVFVNKTLWKSKKIRVRSQDKNISDHLPILIDLK